MKPEEILESAKEAGIEPFKKHERDTENTYEFCDSDLKRFAEFIEKRTIERCAVVCENVEIAKERFAGLVLDDGLQTKLDCARAIRKLGEQ